MNMKPKKAFTRTGSTFSFLAIFFIAVGMHLFHPFLHQQEPGHNHRADNPAYHLQLTSVKASESCPICLFFSSVQVSDKLFMMEKASLPPLSENDSHYRLVPPQRPHHQLFLPRGPPFSIFS